MKRFFKRITRCRLNSDQVGAASIYVSMVIMVILSLIVFAFSQIAVNNYRQAAESQYDLQAYYAAEAAINDVRAAIHENIRQTNKIYGADTELTVEPKGILNGPTSFGSAVFVSGDLLFGGTPDQNKVSIWAGKSGFAWSGGATKIIDANFLNQQGQMLSNIDKFGTSVFVGGARLFVGAPGADSGKGAVYVFSNDNSPSSWTFKNKISGVDVGLTGGERFGAAVAFDNSTSPSTLFVGVPGIGNVFYFSENGNNWTYESKILQNNISSFGAGLSVDDRNLVVGAPGDDKIHIYSKDNNGNWDFANNIIEIYHRTPSDKRNSVPTVLSSGDNFGSSVSMHGSLLAVGAPGYDSGGLLDNGAVHIFEKEGSSWYWKHHISREPVTDPTVQTELTSLTANAAFGQSVSLDSNLLAVGAPGAKKIYFFDVQTNDILNDILASDFSQDCPDQEDAHPAWRNGTLLGGEEGDIRYLCVSVDVAPLELIYDRVDLDRSLLLQLQPVDENNDGVNLSELTIEWAHANQGLSFNFDTATDPKFDTATGWGPDKIPVLRVQVIVINTEQSYNRQNLKNNSKVFFLYPNTKKGSVVWTTNIPPDGSIIGGDCKLKKDFPVSDERHLSCRSVIGLPPSDSVEPHVPGNQLTYLVRIQSIYNKARVVIKGDDINSKSARFKNLQAIVTATGRSSHVAERIRERIPLRPIYDLPEYAIDSAGDLCKILVTTDDTGVYLHDEGDYKDSVYINNPSCSLTK